MYYENKLSLVIEKNCQLETIVLNMHSSSHVIMFTKHQLKKILLADYFRYIFTYNDFQKNFSGNEQKSFVKSFNLSREITMQRSLPCLHLEMKLLVGQKHSQCRILSITPQGLKNLKNKHFNEVKYK